MGRLIKEHSFSISFWFRKYSSKPKPPEGHPSNDIWGSINVRIILNGERVELGFFGVKCWKSQWTPGNCTEPGFVTGEAPFPATNTEEANIKIRHVFNKIELAYSRLKIDPDLRVIHIHHAILLADGKPTPVQNASKVSGAIQEYLDFQIKRWECGEISKTTKVNRHNYARLFKEYLDHAGKSTLQVRDATQGLMDDFKYYLATVKKHKHTHSGKALEFIKQAFSFCLQRKLILENPIAGYIVRKTQTEMDTTHLDEEQLTRLIRFDPYSLSDQGVISEKGAESLDRERDAFVFTCLTGLHDGDYKSRSYEIVHDKSGTWLKGKRAKTGSKWEVPLDPHAMKIIRKYGGIANLPFVSNQKRNDNLKLLAMYAQIPVHMTTKIGRKTFADRALNEMNMGVDDVAHMLGHKDTAFVKHYARIRNPRLIQKFMPIQTEEAGDVRRLPVDTNLEVETTTESVLNKWMA